MTTSPKPMTASERVHAAIAGEQVDRVPFCFWHHFKHEGSGERMAKLTKEFFIDKFKLDIVKIMPDLEYPPPQDQLTVSDQLRFLPRLDLDTPAFQEQLTCIRILRSQIGNDYPLILTLFSPLTYVIRFMGKRKAIEEARKNPQPFEEGLGTIASNLRHLMEATIEAGASGIFFSCMGATNTDFTRDEYRNIGRPYDLEALTLTVKCLMGGLWSEVHLPMAAKLRLIMKLCQRSARQKDEDLSWQMAVQFLMIRPKNGSKWLDV